MPFVITSKMHLDLKKSPQRPQVSIILRQTYMLGPSDFHLDASNTIKAETRSCFFPNSCMMEQNRIGACGKILAYLQNNLVLRTLCKVQSWFKFIVKKTELRKITAQIYLTESNCRGIMLKVLETITTFRTLIYFFAFVTFLV